MRKRITPCSRRGSRWMSWRAGRTRTSTASPRPAPRPGRWRPAACCCAPAPPAARSWPHRHCRRPAAPRAPISPVRRTPPCSGGFPAVGQHSAHATARLAFHLGHPVGEEGLGRRHHHLAARDLHGQHPVPLGVGRAHGLGDLAHVHLERVDAKIIQTAPAASHCVTTRSPAACRRWREHRHGHQAHQRILRALGLRAAAIVRRASSVRRRRPRSAAPPAGANPPALHAADCGTASAWRRRS